MDIIYDINDNKNIYSFLYKDLNEINDKSIYEFINDKYYINNTFVIFNIDIRTSEKIIKKLHEFTEDKNGK